MARTSAREGTNSDPGGQNVSTVPNLGAAQQSSNAWLGPVMAESIVSEGTNGSRPNRSHANYGGDKNGDWGPLFKGGSAGMDNAALKQTNAGNYEKMSWNASGEYGPGSPNYLAGGFGAREQMTIGGDKNEGKLVGEGHNSTPDTDATQYFISGKVPVQMPNNQYLAGTDEARGTNAYGKGTGGYGANESGGVSNNMVRAKKGIGDGIRAKGKKD